MPAFKKKKKKKNGNVWLGETEVGARLPAGRGVRVCEWWFLALGCVGVDIPGRQQPWGFFSHPQGEGVLPGEWHRQSTHYKPDSMMENTLQRSKNGESDDLLEGCLSFIFTVTTGTPGSGNSTACLFPCPWALGFLSISFRSLNTFPSF